MGEKGLALGFRVFVRGVLSASSVVVGDLWVVAARRVKFLEQACSFSCGFDFSPLGSLV